MSAHHGEEPLEYECPDRSRKETIMTPTPMSLLYGTPVSQRLSPKYLDFKTTDALPPVLDTSP
jgi:hypothetical protein